MGSLLVVTGPPGAGKSSVARVLADSVDPSVLIEGDAFYGFLAGGAIEPWRPESNEQNTVVVEASATAAGRFASGGYATIYDGVVGPWFLETFAAATGLDRLDYVILLPSVETCVHRVATRLGHGFTDEAATRQMHAQFADAAIADRHVVRDPPNEVAATASVVASALDNDKLTYAVR